MSHKPRYLEFCRLNTGLPLFFQPYWLDVFGTDWQVLYSKKENIEVFFPYFEEKKLGFTFIRNPLLTPYHGFISNQSLSQIEPNTLQLLCLEILKQLPANDELYLDFHPSLPAELAFDSYTSTLKRTNYLHLTQEDELFKKFVPSLQRQIRKGQKTLSITEMDQMEPVFNLYSTSLKQRGVKPTVDEPTFRKLWDLCRAQNVGNAYIATDEAGQIHATLLLVYDRDTAYYLVGGTDKSFYGSGSMSYLMWHAIQMSVQMGKKIFDFEGSEQEGINRFFMNFSPNPARYLHLEQRNSKLIHWLRKWKGN